MTLYTSIFYTIQVEKVQAFFNKRWTHFYANPDPKTCRVLWRQKKENL